MEIALPVKPGDWIARIGDTGEVAKVKDVYHEDGGTILVDIWLYDREGEKLGRTSPICGGPRTFEPACVYTDSWYRINEPSFPLTLKWLPTPDGKQTAGYDCGPKQPDRQWVRPVRKRKAFPMPVTMFPTNDVRTEIASLRRAAQELRDVARSIMWSDALVKRAVDLERDAKELEGHV